MDATVVSQLTEHLRGQVGLFQEMCTLQLDLLQKLESGEGMSEVLGLLSRKNQLLDAVRARNASAAELVAQWPAVREQLGATPETGAVNALLEQLERAAQDLRGQDEAMIQKFQSAVAPSKPQDRERHSQNVMNAFRAMR